MDMISIRRIKGMRLVPKVSIVWDHMYYRALDGSRLFFGRAGLNKFVPSKV